MNKIILLGNLTRDPETRDTQNSKVCHFTLAVSYGYGERKETAFIDCTVWSKLAELCDKYLEKGSRVLVEGNLKTESWKNKDGDNRSKLVAVLQNVEFMSTNSSKETDEKASETDTDTDSEEDFPF